MTILPLASLMGVLLGWLMGFLSVFLIMLILIQRGKGGGLTGALGGPGGQSAFGSKAGDTFTLITVVVASLWGLTCVVTMLVLGTDSFTPVVAEEPNIQAGPGDEEEPPRGLVIPPSGGLTGSLPSELETSTETPSMDLTPANQQTEGSAAEQSVGDAESASTDTEATSGETDAAETSEAPAEEAASEETANSDDAGSKN
ncbi:MAG: preprotein translocase subunit SecG [Planctomycetes bacterium]|nr:preprotein translocase subunit SecG [Planctomycetota bacterium]